MKAATLQRAQWIDGIKTSVWHNVQCMHCEVRYNIEAYMEDEGRGDQWDANWRDKLTRYNRKTAYYQTRIQARNTIIQINFFTQSSTIWFVSETNNAFNPKMYFY